MWPHAVTLRSTLNMDHISLGVLDVILRYVYSHSMIQNELSNLITSAQKCQLPVLESSLQNNPVECHVVTPMNQETLIFHCGRGSRVV
ncbi:hypothetical protein TNCV_1017601 [Trichonephila clavipes]|uniref:Uncharacterized protein n=1 Tax=Trichonephila clavipes TaxID=2585209 RepID=A0A8X6VYE5_TRICX|nr:hypothetical protein TNCV_1017601 [Trichonephila clavipes]